ncbi:MAG: UDP-N-acetylmuramoyl-tripeptide--D-alanyl-D-alanine ligase [Limnochordales bacterium]|nr:UDP-N-acetylmuramoyl-tripeptide--D-alanyl-D-alanine ligase [Bacillota bacterium]
MDPRTLEQVAADAGGRLLRGRPDAVVTGVATDSRTAQHGRLFVALRGQRFDGHAFVRQAFANGAVAALIRDGADLARELPPGAGLITVDDTLAGLQRLAAAQRSRLRACVIGVTGSVGKTTTKDMIAAIAATRGRVVATRGNFNNEIGLPLTVLDADRDTDTLVVEMGMRAPGEIRALARLARPHVGVVTCVSAVHLERLGSLENIARAKQELVEELPADGAAVLNGDDPLVRGMAARAPGAVLFFGFGVDNDVRATDVELLGEQGSRFVIHAAGRRTRVELPIPGRHHVSNALAAAAAALACGWDLDDVAAGLRAVCTHRSAMRTELVTTPSGVRVINDAYNASPVSMTAALELLTTLPGRRKVAVLGDMLELGPLTEQAHVQLGEDAARRGVDLLITVGGQAATVAEAARRAGMPAEAVVVCRDAEEAAAAALRHVRPGDVVLVKASRGLQLERVVERLTGPGRGAERGDGQA